MNWTPYATRSMTGWDSRKNARFHMRCWGCGAEN